MRRLLGPGGTLIVFVISVYPQRAGLRAPGYPKAAVIIPEKQQDPGMPPVPQQKASVDRFDIIETDGHARILFGHEGPYRSFDDLPVSIRNEFSRSSKLALPVKSDRARPAQVMATFVVSNAGDAADPDLNDGVYSPATLRSAIQNANKLGGSHAITFSPGITTIQPASQLPSVTVALIIDGTVSSGKLVLDGSGTTATVGLSLGKTSTVTNMVFKSWKGLGLALPSGAVNSTVQQCEFSLNGVGLNINASGTTVGSADIDERNLAYGNTQDGIDLVYANDCVVQNNYCGTKDGITASPNTYDGVYILGERNQVRSNLLSGNQSNGLEIGEFSKKTLVQENLIGVDFTGSTQLSNTSNGINTFADNDSIIDNVISGNGYGITILGQASQTYVFGNAIGLNYAHDGLIGNHYGGLQVLGENVVIDDNYICGNTNAGILITGWGGAVVKRNFIGLDPSGTLDWGNTGPGINIVCNNNVIGGPANEDINNISGNDGSGIEMYGGTTLSFPGGSKPNYVRGNIIQNNYIGTDISGSLNIPNSTGISMQGNVDSNFVDQNLISGNQHYGVWLKPSPGSPTRNVFTNNFIGTDADGKTAVPNHDRGVYILAGSNNTFGGPTIEDYNLISGNIGPGVWISGSSSGNKIMSNFIGTDITEFFSLPNTQDGVLIDQSASNNVIQWNLISGNDRNGVTVETNSDLTPNGNSILGNIIGLVYSAESSLPNGDNGVLINNARNTRIGGSTSDSSNIISGNINNGIYIYGDTSTGNMIRGNYIGTDKFVDKSIPNYRGILISFSHGNMIGGSEPASGNFISGNWHEGIYLYVADSNKVYDNVIGLDALQTKTLANGGSGVVVDSAKYNVIGGDQVGTGNTISGNTLTGIALGQFATGNKIFNNSIGTDYTGLKKLGNGVDGIQVVYGANHTTIGKEGAGNKIRFNTLAGIIIGDSCHNTISANSLNGNGELGIDLYSGLALVTPNDDLDPDGGANDLQNFPDLLLAQGPSPLQIFGELHSKPNETYRIEFFSTDSADASGYGEGQTYIGFANVTTNDLGVAAIDATFPVTVSPGKYVTSTATDSVGNTSEFSHSIPVGVSGLYVDVAVTVTDSVHSVQRADTLVYLVTIQNNGPDTATQVVTNDTLSNHVTFISDTASVGNTAYTNGVLTHTIGSLAPGEKVYVVLVVKADSLGSVVNKAYASAHESDYNLSNNVGKDTTNVAAPTAVNDGMTQLPLRYELKQNYPNPFNPTTTIAFDMPSAGHVRLHIFDLLGREVASLVNEHRNAGRHHVEWDASRFSSGVYFYRIESGVFKQTKKLVLMK